MPPACQPSQQMKVMLPDRTERVMDPGPATVGELLSGLGLHHQEVIVARNGTLVPEQAAIGGDDEIRIIRIAHGG